MLLKMHFYNIYTNVKNNFLRLYKTLEIYPYNKHLLFIHVYKLRNGECRVYRYVGTAMSLVERRTRGSPRVGD